ncbi:MAG TPA: VOC family protein [Pyrinomonadaceae bacterium]|nr:VOC family protein [Pyrinomonadaceae bacterium]
MAISIISLQHVNIRVSPAAEAAAKTFYGTLLGLTEVPKPEDARARGGAWYQLGSVQLHLSRDGSVTNEDSKRHICFHVADLEQAKAHLARGGIEILPDDEPVAGVQRFYIRDPGGNLIEVAEGKG